MAITNGYCTVEELQWKLARQRDIQDVKFEWLEESINRASRIIDDMTSRIYYAKTLTSEKVDAFGWSSNGLFMTCNQTKIMLPAPIISITSIVEDSVTLTADSDYYLYDSYIARDGYWTSERKGVVITGSMGYTTTPVYVKEWCLAIAEVISGLGARNLMDAQGDTIAIIKNAIPTWVMTSMATRKMIYV